MIKNCIDCNCEFNAKRSTQKRCKECQNSHNKALRLKSAKQVQNDKRERTIVDMPAGYITAREWAVQNGRSARRGLLIIINSPGFVPGAKKVRNPHGGVDVWAVPANTPWPYGDSKKSRRN